MKLLTRFTIFMVAVLSLVPAFGHAAGTAIGETLLLIPTRGSAMIVIESTSRFDPLVQRLLTEGEIKHWFVVDQPLIQFPQVQHEGYLHELQIRQLDEYLRR
jgi:P pilus assembly chaperone PapD